MPQQGTKLVKVEGQMVRVPVDATPDEIDQIVSGPQMGPPVIHPEATKTGAMQRTPGGQVFSPQDIRRMMNDKLLQQGRYQELADLKEDDPARKAYEASSIRWSGAGMNPQLAMRGIIGTVAGAIPGAAVGRYIGGPQHGNIGAGLGGLVGGLYGGYRMANEKPILPTGLSKIPGTFGKIGRILETFGGGSGEPAAGVPGAAREAAGGTAGESGMSTAPPAGPKNATELSSTVNRVRSGTPPASSTIYTPESLASEQGMSTAALGKPGFNLTIPQRQQDIMRAVQQAPPGTFTPKATTGGFESLGKSNLFSQPPSGATTTGQPESALDAIIRGAPGENPNLPQPATKESMLQEQAARFAKRLKNRQVTGQ